ncbi:hypothetical protein SAMN05421770_11926 [Granulicella rosea]|uniref:Uncharacterized protein n=1 Tax=Granulicella rosea TaxID=474952 RepID=A0A239MP86_9BACT|nr:hypothetical protein [Granulicella rosea]SNT44531.1 hypothetical protein SAMN05421770_11926 [Granulicella rosea]
MNTNAILEAIDAQIRQLQQARDLLVGTNTDDPAIATAKQSSGKRRGRPKGSVNKKSGAFAPVAKKVAKRTLSPEGKARIAAAQKARWAAQKRASVSAKPAAKKTARKKTTLALAPATET